MKTNNKEIFPCIDCITLAICKVQFNSLYYSNRFGILTIFYDSLNRKCSLIRKYLDIKGYVATNDSIKQVYLNKENNEIKQ